MNIRDMVRQYELKWVLPQWLRRRIRRIIPGARPEELSALGTRLYSALTGRVLGGPFRQMRYTLESAGSAFCPKLLGTYEMEIAPVIESAVTGGYQMIVDIGAAEGYYAVGLALRVPDARVIAFEQSPAARRLLSELAALNAVNRLEIRESCSTEGLGEILSAAPPTLIVCDIDGAELEVLDPQAVPALAHCDILVETHDCFRPGLSRQIMIRFAQSHEIMVTPSRKRRARDCPAGLSLSARDAYLAVQEHRPGPQSWFWMRARRPSLRGEPLRQDARSQAQTEASHYCP